MSLRLILTFLSSGFLMASSWAGPSPDLRQVLDPAEPGKGDSLLWTALVARSWQELGTVTGVPNIDLRLPDGRTPNRTCETLHGTVAQLDKVLPPTTKVWSGEITPAFLTRINQELTTLFPGRLQRISAPSPLLPGSCVAVTALDHRLSFAKPFYEAKGRTMKFRTSAGKITPVTFFGTLGKANETFSVYAVQVHAYRSATDFILEISTRDQVESLWIVRSPGTPSLQNHFEAVKPFASVTPSGHPPEEAGLTALDAVQIPYVDFTHLADHTKSLAGQFMGPNNTPFRIVGCHQWLNFELTEGGAVIRAKVDLIDAPFGEAPPPPKKPKPRQFICDGPFSLLLWRPGAALPYAAFHLDGGKWQ